MTEAPMFAQAAPRTQKSKRQEKGSWLIALVFILIGIAAGVFTAPPLAIEPSGASVSAVLSAKLTTAFLCLLAVMGGYLVLCMVLKRSVGVPAALAVGAVAFAAPMVAPLAVDRLGGVLYPEERAVLAALDEDRGRRIAEQRARLAGADLETLIQPETFSKRDFKAYDARVQDYRAGADALKALAGSREGELRERLAASGVASERQAKMLEKARADAAVAAAGEAELYGLRVRAAEKAASAFAMLRKYPNNWRMWYGQLAFGDPQLGADFSQEIAASRGALVNLRRLEGKLGVIGATAQKRAS